jgi:hypothetical protein
MKDGVDVERNRVRGLPPLFGKEGVVVGRD